MSSSPRGYAVIITMTKGRPGADVDDRDIAELFQQLSFDIIKLKDNTREVFPNIKYVFICLHYAFIMA